MSSFKLHHLRPTHRLCGVRNCRFRLLRRSPRWKLAVRDVFRPDPPIFLIERFTLSKLFVFVFFFIRIKKKKTTVCLFRRKNYIFIVNERSLFLRFVFKYRYIVRFHSLKIHNTYIQYEQRNIYYPSLPQFMSSQKNNINDFFFLGYYWDFSSIVIILVEFSLSIKLFCKYLIDLIECIWKYRIG